MCVCVCVLVCERKTEMYSCMSLFTMCVFLVCGNSFRS